MKLWKTWPKVYVCNKSNTSVGRFCKQFPGSKLAY